MGLKCNTQGKDERFIRHLIVNPEGRVHFVDVAIGGRVILENQG
jgi:hypothetical protein